MKIVNLDEVISKGSLSIESEEKLEWEEENIHLNVR
jgi:hypothetical protein